MKMYPQSFKQFLSEFHKQLITPCTSKEETIKSKAAGSKAEEKSESNNGAAREINP